MNIQKTDLRVYPPPIPSPLDPIAIEFNKIPEQAPDRKERGWQLVVTQKCGLDVIKACVLYVSLFGKRDSVVVQCLAGAQVVVERALFEALKKDSNTLRSLAEDVAEVGIQFHFYRGEFESLIHELYPGHVKAGKSLSLVRKIELANYLDMPILFKRYVQELQDTVRLFDAHDEAKAHELYESLLKSQIRTQPFIKEVIYEEFAEYFGRLIHTKAIPFVDRYAALTFGTPVHDELIGRLASLQKLKRLTIEQGAHLTRWPTGFESLETLIIKDCGLRDGTFPENLLLLDIDYNRGQMGGLIRYPSRLQTLSLRCANYVKIEAPTSLRTLVLKGLLYVHNLPPKLECLKIEGFIPEDVPFSTSLRTLAVNTLGTSELRAAIKGLSLVDLKLAPNARKTPEMLRAIPKTVRKLKTYWSGLTPEEIAQLPPNLESFSLYNSISGLGLTLLHLQKLTLMYCETLRDEDLKHLSRDLKALSIRHCPNIGNEGMAHLPSDLEKLKLENVRISDAGIARIPRKLRELILKTLFLTTACFVHIPRGVEVLGLHVTLNATNWEYLPKTLRTLYLTESNLYRLPRVVKVIKVAI